MKSSSIKPQSKGGLARAAAQRRKEIALQAARARWDRKPDVSETTPSAAAAAVFIPFCDDVGSGP